MQLHQRRVKPEWLDTLPCGSAAAIRSRADLRRVNVCMGNASRIAKHVGSVGYSPVERIVDLGAGDGTFLVKVFKRLPAIPRCALLVDRQPALDERNRRRLEELGCKVEMICGDAFSWLGLPRKGPNSVFIANLFLHHFVTTDLRRMLELVSERCEMFVACEPRRSRLALKVSGWLGLLGCSPVTRHDAIVSVEAGFSGSEISCAWPRKRGWELREYRAGFFSHLFSARNLGGV